MRMDTGQGIAVAGAVVALVWGIVQIGDRLWRRGSQSLECQYDHQKITATLQGLHEAQRDLLRAHADMLRTITETNLLNKQEIDAARQRHHEVVQSLTRIEKMLRDEGMVRT